MLVVAEGQADAAFRPQSPVRKNGAAVPVHEGAAAEAPFVAFARAIAVRVVPPVEEVLARCVPPDEPKIRMVYRYIRW